MASPAPTALGLAFLLAALPALPALPGLAPVAHAAPPACAVPSDGAYACTVVALALEDAGAGTLLALGDDALSPAIPLGFTFPFYGAAYASAHVSSNGFVAFAPTSAGCCAGSPLASPQAPNNLVACFWEDLDPSRGGSVRFLTKGAAPQRVFVVEFRDVPYAAFGGRNTFQIHLLETGEARCMVQEASIDLNPLSPALPDANPVVAGTENPEGTRGVRHVLGEVPPAGFGLHFTPLPPSEACAGPACVRVVHLAKITDLSLPGAGGPPQHTLVLERGALRVDAQGTFAEQDVLVPRLDGQPDPALLNQNLGAANTTYTFEALVCVEGQCSFGLGSAGEQKVGELWSARLQVFVGGNKVSDAPFVAARLS